MFLDPAIERQMFAAVNDFLLDEGTDFILQFCRRLIPKLLDAFDKKSLAAREGEGQAIIEGGRDGVTILPVFSWLMSGLPTKATVARLYLVAGRGWCVDGFRFGIERAKHIHQMFPLWEMQLIAGIELIRLLT